MLTIENVPVPFFAEIKNGLPHGSDVDLSGDAICSHERAIWFEYKTRDGTALHLNIRMGQKGQNNVVVNSYHNGHWGHEHQEHSSVSPPGPLQIHVECHDNHFSINVNSRSFHFPHRLKKHDIDRLEIKGDLIIRRLSFRNMENHIQLLGNYQQPGYPSPQPYLPSSQSYGAPPSLGQTYQGSYGSSQPQALPSLGQGYYPNQPPQPYGAPPHALGQPPPGSYSGLGQAPPGRHSPHGLGQQPPHNPSGGYTYYRS